ncbi:unnamed protein product [Hydatigera taeniaeformis]|uniref:EGF-like domain-containing protein n=1 Tax=Hydatigena taeniaeformis TaxID=6205 RepID=A0A0R3WPS8_HYDTA|nr:unnamed protein product [Hydatigera taeniaeformis]
MDGMPTEPEYREENVITQSKESSDVEAITLPLHSRCVGKPGTESYFCQCERPFVEDISLAASNCLLQVGSCDSKLCVHGVCVTTANQRGMAVCMCYAGYMGPQCNQKVEACPPRLGKDCPITFLLGENYTDVGVDDQSFSFVSLFDVSNPDVIRLQTFAATCAVLLITFIQILRCVTFMLVL